MATIWKIAARSAYDMFLWYKYLNVNLVFPTSVFWSGNLFLIAPFPGLCLFLPCYLCLSDQKEILTIVLGKSYSFLS